MKCTFENEYFEGRRGRKSHGERTGEILPTMMSTFPRPKGQHKIRSRFFEKIPTNSTRFSDTTGYSGVYRIVLSKLL